MTCGAGSIPEHLSISASQTVTGIASAGDSVDSMDGSIKTDASTGRSFTGSLLRAGKITQHEHDTLTALITHDVSKAAHKDALEVSVPGNITIGWSVTHRAMEAVAAVLNTAVLLKAILLTVPAADLIVGVPRVCRGFRQAIDASIRLQEKTWRPMCPDGSRSVSCFPVATPGFTFDVCYDSYAWLEVKTQDIGLAVRGSSGLQNFQMGHPKFKTLRIVWLDTSDGSRCPEDYLMQDSDGLTLAAALSIMEARQLSSIKLRVSALYRVARDRAGTSEVDGRGRHGLQQALRSRNRNAGDRVQSKVHLKGIVRVVAEAQ